MNTIKLIATLILTITSISCSQAELSSENIMWNDSSVKFSTITFAGVGDSPSWAFPLGQDGITVCQQDSYSYEFEDGVLTKSICTDRLVGYERFEKELNSSELLQMESILNISFIPKDYSGENCLADGGPSPDFIQIYQADGTIRILNTNSDLPCGEASEEYIYGQIENFYFIDELDKILFENE